MLEPPPVWPADATRTCVRGLCAERAHTKIILTLLDADKLLGLTDLGRVRGCDDAAERREPRAGRSLIASSTTCGLSKNWILSTRYMYRLDRGGELIDAPGDEVAPGGV